MTYKPPKAIAKAGIETGATKAKLWGTLPSFFAGAVFSLGLIVAGSELLTGNMALVPLAAMRGRASFRRLAENWFFVLLGSLFVAYFLAVKSGAFLGNAVGALIFVAAAYWYLYAQQEEEEPGDTPSGAPERRPEEVTA